MKLVCFGSNPEFLLCEEELNDPSHVTQKQLNQLWLDFHPNIHLNDLESQD